MNIMERTVRNTRPLTEFNHRTTEFHDHEIVGLLRTQMVDNHITKGFYTEHFYEVHPLASAAANLIERQSNRILELEKLLGMTDPS